MLDGWKYKNIEYLEVCCPLCKTINYITLIQRAASCKMCGYNIIDLSLKEQNLVQIVRVIPENITFILKWLDKPVTLEAVGDSFVLMIESLNVGAMQYDYLVKYIDGRMKKLPSDWFNHV